MNLSAEFSAAEREAFRVEYLNQITDGSMSGRELIEQLQSVCGLSLKDASEQWASIKPDAAVYKSQIGSRVFAFIQGRWQECEIVSFYLGTSGAVVDVIESGARLPFSLYELRVT